jgi:hypothetical protein
MHKRCRKLFDPVCSRLNRSDQVDALRWQDGGSRKLLGCGSRVLPHQATHGFLELRIHRIGDGHHIQKPDLDREPTLPAGSTLCARPERYTRGPADDLAKRGVKGRIKVDFCAHPFGPPLESTQNSTLLVCLGCANAPHSVPVRFR